MRACTSVVMLVCLLVCVSVCVGAHVCVTCVEGGGGGAHVCV